MRATVLLNSELTTRAIPDPVPGEGMLITRPLACGICGSDLHARHHAEHLCSMLHGAGFRGFMDPKKPVVMGHEFCCEVLETQEGFERGQRVVALPFIQGPNGIELIGYSNNFNGAFAEQMLLQSSLSFAVPDHVPANTAALAEPLSVAVHAVAEADADSECAYAVIGCGPVGLFVIARLRALR